MVSILLKLLTPTRSFSLIHSLKEPEDVQVVPSDCSTTKIRINELKCSSVSPSVINAHFQHLYFTSCNKGPSWCPTFFLSGCLRAAPSLSVEVVGSVCSTWSPLLKGTAAVCQHKKWIIMYYLLNKELNWWNSQSNQPDTNLACQLSFFSS